MHPPSNTLHAALSRRGVRQGLMRVAVVLLTVVVGVAVLDQRRVSKRNVRSHDTYWSHATHWPSRAARKTRLAAGDGDDSERELVDGEAEGAGAEETEAPTAARAPMPWPTPAPRPKKKTPLFDDENVDDAATEFPTPERAPMPWPTPAPPPRPRPESLSGGLVF